MTGPTGSGKSTTLAVCSGLIRPTAGQILLNGIDAARFSPVEYERDLAKGSIERQIKKEARLSLEISHVNWFSLYKVHSRHVNKFSEGRCYVAGDAANRVHPAVSITVLVASILLCSPAAAQRSAVNDAGSNVDAAWT